MEKTRSGNSKKRKFYGNRHATVACIAIFNPLRDGLEPSLQGRKSEQT